MIKIIEHDVNEHGNNKDIKFHCLDDETMIKNGFRRCDNYDSNRFYLCESIGHNISINVGISRDNLGEIDMLDEDFCQPYDWQYMMVKYGCQDKYICNVQEKAYAVMTRLKEAGIISNWEIGDYI